MDFQTVAGVELASAGMEWPAVTGPFTVSPEHLADVATAANDDPHIQIPRIKLGHYSEVNGSLLRIDPFEAIGDATPAFGRVNNLRLENDGAVLVGDFIEVPEWLAEGLPSFYASRSCDWHLNQTTPGGKTYTMVISAVCLLGVELPAIQDLEDLERLLIEGPGEEAITTARPATGGRNMPGSTAATSVSAGVIRQRFNFDWAMDPDSAFEGADGEMVDPYWWWARDVRVDPMEVIADDDNGNCWSIPVTTDGADEVTFGEPVRVREDFVPIATSAGEQPSSFERPEKPDRSQTASGPDEEETMADIDIARLRERTGLSEDDLPDDATAEQINEALAAEQEDPPAGDPPADDPPAGDPPADDPPADDPPADPPPESTSIDSQALADLQARASRGDEARTQQESDDRDEFIETAVKAGKFTRTVGTAYRAQLSQGGEVEAQVRTHIDGLAEKVVPLEEQGVVTTTANDDAEMALIMQGFGVKSS